MTERFQSTTAEWVPVPVLRDDVLTPMAGVSYSTSVVLDGQGPGTYTACTVIDGRPCFRVQGMAAGRYRLFAKATTADEAAVLDCGVFIVV